MYADISCGECHGSDTRVIDSRATIRMGGAIRRRRECLTCHARFTTYETRIVTPDVLRAFLQLQAAMKEKAYEALRGM